MMYKKYIKDYLKKYSLGSKLTKNDVIYIIEDVKEIEVITDILETKDSLGNRPLLYVKIRVTYNNGNSKELSLPLAIKNDNKDFIIVRTIGDLLK